VMDRLPLWIEETRAWLDADFEVKMTQRFFSGSSGDDRSKIGALSSEVGSLREG
jgi:hypothetical protein